MRTAWLAEPLPLWRCEDPDGKAVARRSNVCESWAIIALLSEFETMYAISSAGLLAPLTASAAPIVITA
jgi:hypothetical protein